MYFTSDMKLEHFVYYLENWYFRDVKEIVANAEKKAEDKELNEKLALVREGLVAFQRRVSVKAELHNFWYCHKHSDTEYKKLDVDKTGKTPLEYIGDEIRTSQTMKPAFSFGIRLSNMLQFRFFAGLPKDQDMFSTNRAPVNVPASTLKRESKKR